jgi:hypothetical protein
VGAPSLSASRALAAAEQLDDLEGAGTSAATTEGLLRLHATLAETAGRQRRLVERYTAGHPGIPVVEVPASSSDIHDLAGLREVGRALTA